MDYDFRRIEKEWQKHWANNKTFKARNNSDKPKYYVLDMFPYPSGAGLHVGHPLGYIASDIYARYKRLKGFNVLHPMGYDSFGLPAEQYAIQTGQHPAQTTKENIARYRQQLDQIGFSFDWDREVRTSDPSYYKWTQWIFIQLFNSWYNKKTDRAEKIDTLIAEFEKNGNAMVDAACDPTPVFSAEHWKKMPEEEHQTILLNYRLTFLSEAMVNWCPALGTVLANDEVVGGVSERGGHPVIQKKMTQWSMRITAYAERLLQGLNNLDWPDSLKEMQRNWIGKSEGCSIRFNISDSDFNFEVFTTRPDTIFGVTYMTLAPEHDLVMQITTPDRKAGVDAYIASSAKKSERDRMSDVKTISGEFTGAYAIHPFTGENIPIWIGDYVLAGYGTGAVMAVPAHDSRDYAFAKHFNLPIKPVVEVGNIEKASHDAKEGKMINSEFLDGLEVKDAIKTAIQAIEDKGIGKGKINYRLRNAVFGRQRYWGEPIPIYYKNGIPYPVDEADLPIELPEVDKYLPTEDGEPPLARAKKEDWNVACPGDRMEYNTMPGWAGSSWYFLRYMDPENTGEFVSKEAADYWNQVDLYIGGAEHATGHLLYFRFWTKFFYDMGYIGFDEPAKKLINQGMIQGVSKFVRTLKTAAYGGPDENSFINSIMVSEDKKLEKMVNEFIEIVKHVSIDRVLDVYISNDVEAYQASFIETRAESNYFNNSVLEYETLISSKPALQKSLFICQAGIWYNNKFYKTETNFGSNTEFIARSEVEKMSKSKFNVVNPDELVERYGADTLRLYEMFLGPLEQHKPWDTQGIEGTHRFLRKFWRLFHDAGNQLSVSDEEPTKAELKALHKTIKKVEEDILRYSFNTPVSEFMICVNELTELKCNKRAVLEPLTILVAPYAPHIAEELWRQLGHNESITYASFPVFNTSYLVEDSHKYPVSFNGKMRYVLELPTSLTKEEIEAEVMANEQSEKWLEGRQPKKIIVVPKKIVNIVM